MEKTKIKKSITFKISMLVNWIIHYWILQQASLIFWDSPEFIFQASITAPQDAHTRLVLQVYLGLNTLESSAIHRYKFTATKPEVEGFRDQGFVLLKSKKPWSSWKKHYPQGSSQTSIYQSWIVRHAFILTLYARILLFWSAVVHSIPVAMILYVGILNTWRHVREKIECSVLRSRHAPPRIV